MKSAELSPRVPRLHRTGTHPLLGGPARNRAAVAPGQFLLAVLLLALTAGRASAQLFTEIAPALPNTAYPCVAWGDYDGDGDLDVLMAGLGRHDIAFSTIYTNSGGIFTDSGIVLLGLSRATAAWGDFDADGDLDLAMTGVTTAGIATTQIWRNNGATFATLPGSFSGVLAGNVAWGDYDNDGDLDLLVTGLTSPNAAGVAVTRLYRNDGGVFTSVAHPFPNCYLGAVAWGDYNNDGKLDVLIAGVSDTAGMVAALWRNDGGGAFTNTGADVPGMDLGFAAWGDYDNEGDVDLLFGGDSNTAGGRISRIYRNDGGTLVDVGAGLMGLLWSSAAWGDYDNDGDLDIVTFGYDAVGTVTRSFLYRNDAGTFVDSGAVFHNLFLGTLSWADYDNDGDLDLLLAGNSGGFEITRLYRNDTSTSNSPPGAPANLAATVAGATVSFSWSPASDDHTPSPGLSYNLRVGTTPGGSQIVSPQSGAGGYRRLPALGNAQSGLTAQLRNLQPGTSYYWSVQAVDGGFAGSAFAAEGTWNTPTSVEDPAGEASASPREFALLANQPNPFGPVTRITFAVPVAARVTLAIYDAAGRRVRTLVDAERQAGVRDVSWDGTDARGDRLPAGIYFYCMQAGSFTQTRRMVRLAG